MSTNSRSNDRSDIPNRSTLEARLRAVAELADEWERLSGLTRPLSFEAIRKASEAQRTLWEMAGDLRDTIGTRIEPCDTYGRTQTTPAVSDGEGATSEAEEYPGCRAIAKMAEGIDAAMAAEFDEYPPEPMSADLRQRLIAAAERPLKVRREAFKLAGFATGHRKRAHSDTCDKCREHWPCVDVRRAAGPLLDSYNASLDARPSDRSWVTTEWIKEGPRPTSPVVAPSATDEGGAL